MGRRIRAVIRARLREFYRDKASLMWNLAMPLLIILGFAFIFSGEPEDLFKVGVVGDTARTDPQASPFLATDHVRFIPVADVEAAVLKVQRHQLDMLLDLRGAPRYWINQHSAQGYLAERVLQQAYGGPVEGLTRETVSGQAIRYADWLMPGVLAR